MYARANFKKGMVWGGLLGGALVALFTTKQGKLFRKEVQEGAEELYEKLLEKTKDLAEYSQEKYNTLAEVLSEEYAHRRAWSEQTTKRIAQELKQRWWALQAYLLYQELREKTNDLSNLTKREYYALVDDIVQEYTTKKGWLHAVSAKITRELRRKWDDIKEEIED